MPKFKTVAGQLAVGLAAAPSLLAPTQAVYAATQHTVTYQAVNMAGQPLGDKHTVVGTAGQRVALPDINIDGQVYAARYGAHIDIPDGDSTIEKPVVYVPRKIQVDHLNPDGTLIKTEVVDDRTFATSDEVAEYSKTILVEGREYAHSIYQSGTNVAETVDAYSHLRITYAEKKVDTPATPAKHSYKIVPRGGVAPAYEVSDRVASELDALKPGQSYTIDHYAIPVDGVNYLPVQPSTIFTLIDPHPAESKVYEFEVDYLPEGSVRLEQKVRDKDGATTELKPASVITATGELTNETPALQVDGYRIVEINTQDLGGQDAVAAQVFAKAEVIYEKIDTTPTPQPNAAPTIIANDVEIEFGQAFDLMTGVTATDAEEGDLTAKIVLVSNGGFDSNQAGRYVVRYQVTDKEGAVTEAERIVTVKEKPAPPKEPNRSPELGIAYDSFRAVVGGVPLNLRGNVNKALDHEDGDMSGKVVINAEGATETADGYVWSAPGTYTVTYSITDSEGAVATATMTVVVRARPVITAAPTVQLFVGQDASALIRAAGVTASDQDGNPLIPQIEGAVDFNTPGVYQVIFVATDDHGVDARITTTLVVIEAPKEGVVIVSADKYTATVGKPIDILAGLQVSHNGRTLTPQEVAGAAKVNGAVDWNTPGTYSVRVTLTLDGKEYTKDVSVEVVTQEEAQSRADSAAASTNIPTQAVNVGATTRDKVHTGYAGVAPSGDLSGFLVMGLGLVAGLFKRKRK